jgi:hypothetical protein
MVKTSSLSLGGETMVLAQEARRNKRDKIITFFILLKYEESDSIP